MDRRVGCERHEGGKVSARRVKRAERDKRRRREREKEMGMRYARSVKRAER